MAVIDFEIVGGAIGWTIASATEVFVEPADPGLETADEYRVERVCTCAASTSATPADVSNYAFATVAPWSLHQLRNPADAFNPTSDSATYSESSTGVASAPGTYVFTGSWQEVKDRFDAGDISKGFISATVVFSEGTLDFSVDTTGSYEESVTHEPVAPIITSLSPSYGPPSGGTVVTITGKFFNASAVVRFGGYESTTVTYVDSTTVTAVAPASAFGLFDVSIDIDNDGVRTGTLVEGYEYTTLVVLFDGVAGTGATVVDALHISATAPAHIAGAVRVEVVKNDLTLAAEPGIYTYIGDEPLIDPDSGPAAGGTAVTITGIPTIEDAEIIFGSASATSVVTVDPSTYTAVTAAHSAGLVNVSIDSTSGPVILTDAFTYEGLILIPNNGPSFGGTTVLLAGVEVPEEATLELREILPEGGDPEDLPDPIPIIINFETDPPSFTAPPHAPIDVLFVLTVPDPEDEEATLEHSAQYTYYVYPSYTPPGGEPAGETLVTFRRWFFEEGDGTEFVPDATITFGGLPATEITFVNVDTYTCLTPPHARGAVDIVVTNISSLGLVMTYPLGYAYNDSLPAPEVNAGPDLIAHGPAPSTVHVEGSCSDVTWTPVWDQTGGPVSALIVSASSFETDVTFATYTPGVYTFRLTCSVDDKPPISDTMTVTIFKQNPPNITITGGAP